MSIERSERRNARAPRRNIRYAGIIETRKEISSGAAQPAIGSESSGADAQGSVVSHCLVQTVADAMKHEPALEAVKIDRARRSISVATLGKPAQSGLEKELTGRIQQIESSGTSPRCALLEGGVDDDCSSCAVPWEAQTRGGISVKHDQGTTTISRVTCPTAPRFWRWRDFPWPRLTPREIRFADETGEDTEWRGQLIAAGLCGLFGLAGFFATEIRLAVALNILAFLAGGWFPAHEVWERLQKRILDVHFLMLAVALGSASIGAWSEGAMLLFLFSLSGGLEHYAMGRTQREIRSLFRTAPKTAIVLDLGGTERVVPVSQLRAGMRLLMKPGEQFPVDGEVTAGKTAADESNLTGEAAPVEKAVGDPVLGGTLNLWGVAEITVSRPASQSALQRIIHLIKEAQHLKAPSQRFTDLFGTRYTYLILALSVTMFLVWWLVMDRAPLVSAGETKSAFYLAMTLLVVSSPCALVLSIPSAVLAAIAWAARRGILFRGGAAVENLAGIDVVAMDKTGTLTTGELAVERVESFPAGREEDVAQLAYSLERLSTHPLARAITRYGKRRQLNPLPLEGFESVTGLGLRAFHEKQKVLLGRREWLAKEMASDALSQAPHPPPGHSEVWIARGALIGRILLRDDIRPQAKEVVRRLHALGLKTVVLTGDRRGTGEQLAAQLSIEDVRSELKPEEKVEVIRSFGRAGQKVAMIGDGVNDAPSLAVADVAVAMGARGSDAALEQADVVLMHDRLENFYTAFRLSQRARRIIRQNLILSLGTVVVLLAFAATGNIPLTAGVIGHEGSTVLVVLNSLRLLLKES